MSIDCSTPSVALVVPIHDEEETIPALRRRVTAVIDEVMPRDRCQVIVVDDGSRDASLAMLRSWAEEDGRVEVVELTRNFGHQAALRAGLDRADADVVVTMDGDLQDPPELITQMLALHRGGAEMVTARRRSRPGESAFKRLSAALFYRLFERACGFRCPRDVGDFRSMTRPVVEALRGWAEPRRVLRASIAYLGFRATNIEFDRLARAAGTSKYGVTAMGRLALDAFVAHSRWPVHFPLVGGALGIMVLLGVGAVAGAMGFPLATSGAAIAVGAASVLLALAMIGEYVVRLVDAVSGRPAYTVRAIHRRLDDTPARCVRAATCGAGER